MKRAECSHRVICTPESVAECEEHPIDLCQDKEMALVALGATQ
jgi:hypothetical protein